MSLFIGSGQSTETLVFFRKESDMSCKKVGSHKKVKNHHRERILQEAVRLNGSANSMRGKIQLRRYAKNELGIVIDDLTLSRLLRGQNGNGAHLGKPPCKRRSICSILCH